MDHVSDPVDSFVGTQFFRTISYTVRRYYILTIFIYGIVCGNDTGLLCTKTSQDILQLYLQYFNMVSLQILRHIKYLSKNQKTDFIIHTCNTCVSRELFVNGTVKSCPNFYEMYMVITLGIPSPTSISPLVSRGKNMMIFFEHYTETVVIKWQTEGASDSVNRPLLCSHLII